MGAACDEFEIPPETLDCVPSAAEVAAARASAEPGIVIAQPRALEALAMGMDIRARGYNIFVSGAPGTGRRSAVLSVLERRPAEPEALRDLAYVCNFRNTQAPALLSFPRGEARRFKKDLHRLVENVKALVRKQEISPAFRQAQKTEVQAAEALENSLLEEFERALGEAGLRAVQTGDEDEKATDLVPLWKGEPSSFDELEDKVADGELSKEELEAMRSAYADNIDRLRSIFDRLRQERAALEERIEKLRARLIRPRIQAELDWLLSRHAGENSRHAGENSRHPGDAAAAWMRELDKDIMAHLRLFGADAEERDPGPPMPGLRPVRSPLSRYGINVLADRSGMDRRPLVFEDLPSPSNLFGSIEHLPDGEEDWSGAYLRIRAGSLIQASGGYLILKAEDLVEEEESWPYLKRVLQTGKLEIQGQSGPMGPAPAGIKPEPVSVDLKVIMIGNEMSYDILYQQDADFQKLFKVAAEFDSSMPLSPDSLRDYLSFIKKVQADEGLKPFDDTGVAALLERGIRLSEYRRRISTRFSRIADLMRESDYQARRTGAAVIGQEEVLAAVARRAWLSSLPEEKLGEMILSGEIVLAVSGSAVGRVNGLAVHDRGYYAFGMPAVISAQVAPGASGVINIEGESGLSGEIYDKAVLIVEGFLRARYARDFPLSVTASICFEQSYNAIEGDSASSTAVYALLSAIAGIPLRQDVAVTGSVNQMGQIQPVGGVPEKIEGFYSICKRAGFTGTQGVMIPRQNAVNLTLSREVVAAVREGRFHIWAVSSIDEGISVLTGSHPGLQGADGAFPEGSFNHSVRHSLKAMALLMREYTA